MSLASDQISTAEILGHFEATYEREREALELLRPQLIDAGLKHLSYTTSGQSYWNRLMKKDCENLTDRMPRLSLRNADRG